MKEGHNKLDDLFKSALDDYTKEPSPNILKKLDNKMLFRDIVKMNFKNFFTKSFIKYASIIIVSVSTFFVSTYIYNNNSKTNNINLNQTQIETNNPDKIIQPVIIEPNDTLHKFISNNNLIGDGRTNSTKTNKTPVPEQNLDYSKSNSDKTGFSEKNNAQLLVQDNINDATKKPLTINNSENNQSKINNSRQEQNDNIISNKRKIALDSTFDKKKIISLTYLNQKEILKNQNNSDSSLDMYNLEGYKNLSYNITQLQPIPALTIKSDGEVTKSDFIIIDSKNSLPSPQDKRKSKNLFPKYSVEIYGGADYVGKILSSSLNAYIDERKNSEKPIYTYNFGADFKYTLKNAFVQAGISKTIFGENLTITSITLSVDTSASHFHYDYHQYFIIDTIGWSWDSVHFDSIPILDSAVFNQVDSNWVSVYDSINKKNTNKYKNRLNYFEIPVLIGFNFGNSPLRFNVATGVSFGFLTNSKGKLVRPYTHDLTDFNKDNFPLNKIIYNYLLRAGCYYQYNEKCNLFLRAAFKYNMNSIFDKSYPVNQKYFTIGIQAGLSFNF